MKKTFTLAKITFIAVTLLFIGGFDLTSSSAQSNGACVDGGYVTPPDCKCQTSTTDGCYISPGTTGCGVCQKPPKGGGGGGEDPENN